MAILKDSSLEKSPSSKFYLWLGASPIILSIVLSLIILFFFKNLPPKLPLLYSLPWGEKQLVSHQQFLIIPAVITLIALLNLVLSWQLHFSQAFFKKTLLIASFITCIIFIVTFVKIVTIFI